MFKRVGVLFFYTLTPLHPGSGASVAAVDLPIQRERHTHYPLIQASGVKGALRDLSREVLQITAEDLKTFNQLRGRSLSNEEKSQYDNLAKKILPWETVFGPETDRASDHGGALSLTDARLLLFPVRSVRGVFAWITCPGVIERFKRDLLILKATNGLQNDSGLQELTSLNFTSSPWNLDASQACAPSDSDVVLQNDKIVLEDFCFTVVDNGDQRNQVKQLAQGLAEHALPEGLEYWKEKLKRDLVVLSDDAFKEFVEMSTEVITRIKLGEKGTVDQGPWDEEHLPAETLLYSLALATKPKKEHDNIKSAQDVLRFLREELVGKVSVVQFGGDETVGKGLVKVRCLDGRSEKETGEARAQEPAPAQVQMKTQETGSEG